MRFVATDANERPVELMAKYVCSENISSRGVGRCPRTCFEVTQSQEPNVRCNRMRVDNINPSLDLKES